MLGKIQNILTKVVEKNIFISKELLKRKISAGSNHFFIKFNLKVNQCPLKRNLEVFYII